MVGWLGGCVKVKQTIVFLISLKRSCSFCRFIAYYYRLRKKSAEKKIKLLKDQVALVCSRNIGL